MAQGLRFAKSAKGTAEIGERRNNLRGKLRIMLILVDPTKTAEQLRLQAAKIGAPAETLEMLQRDGYIEPTGPALVDANGYAGARDAPPVPDEAARFGKAKGFMNETLAAGLGVRAAELRAQVERCSTRTELKNLLPQYEAAIAGVSGDAQADMLATSLRKLLA